MKRLSVGKAKVVCIQSRYELHSGGERRSDAPGEAHDDEYVEADAEPAVDELPAEKRGEAFAYALLFHLTHAHEIEDGNARDEVQHPVIGAPVKEGVGGRHFVAVGGVGPVPKGRGVVGDERFHHGPVHHADAMPGGDDHASPMEIVENGLLVMPAELDLAVGGKRDEKDKETAQQIQQDIPPSEALCREVVDGLDHPLQ